MQKPILLAIAYCLIPVTAFCEKATESPKSENSQIGQKLQLGYFSWIENELFPLTREYIQRNETGLRRRCIDSEIINGAKPARSYVAIGPYAEVDSAINLRFSSKAFFTSTQSLFRDELQGNFRSAFNCTEWDGVESQQLTSPNANSERFELEFPNSKEYVSRTEIVHYFVSGATYVR